MVKTKTVKWRKSKAKEQLRSDIIKGIVPDEMTAEIVYDMHDGAYHPYDFKNFKVNLKNLRDVIKKRLSKAQVDEVALRNTIEQRTLITEGRVEDLRYPRWNKSSAQALLTQDVASGIVNTMKPAELWMTRPEYRIYPLSVFRDHIYKEKIKPLSRAYWDHQRAISKGK